MAKKPYGVAAYESAQRTVPPLQAVVMLYDGIIRHLKFFVQAAEEKDVLRQLDEAKKANQIVEGLNTALDMEQGGAVAIRLRDTYMSISVALFRCVGQPDGKAACEKLINAVSVLRDAWAEIAEVPLLDPSRAGMAAPVAESAERADVEAG